MSDTPNAWIPQNRDQRMNYDLDDLRAQLEATEEENEKWSHENKRLNDYIDVLEKQRDLDRDRINVLDAEIEKLEEKVDDLDKTLEAKSDY